MTKCYDDILSTADLENLDSFLNAWESVVSAVDTLATVTPGARKALAGMQDGLAARRKEAKDLRRKLAVAIHYSQGGDRP